MMHLKKLWAVFAVLALMLGVLPAQAESYDMPYYITVDLTNQIVTVYNTSDNTIVRQMLCSSGKNDSTPEGTFYLPKNGRASERSEWTWLDQYKVWVKYATRIDHGYMFHSLPFTKKDMSTMQEQPRAELGLPTSHGCMRLLVDDARFIAKNCLMGTRVRIYKEEEKDEELRQLLAVSSFVSGQGMTYAEFLGYSENDLGRGAGGTQVGDLQHRLTALGYYEGEISGNYSADTVAAVKHVQADLGLPQSGVTNEELAELLYSADAPVSEGQITLQEGRSGPVVKRLQSALQTLGIYDGELDSVYDVDVADAVRLFQGAYNYKVDGVATPEIQQALYYEVDKLEEIFGADNAPSAQVVTEEVVMATLHSNGKVIIRSKPDTKGTELGKINDGGTVIVTGANGDWAKIKYGSVTGYVLKRFLEAYSQDNVIINYYDAAGNLYRLGHTMQEYYEGAQSGADAFEAYQSEQRSSAAAVEAEVSYVIVATGSDDVKLNLRASAGSDGEVLAEVPNGTSLQILSQADGWTQVNYESLTGYLLNDYLSFSDDGDVDDDYAPEIEEGDTIMAVVISGSQGSAPVYDAGSADAKQVGSLPEGTSLEVVSLSDSDDWVLIRYKGHEGYMLDDNLQFQLM